MPFIETMMRAMTRINISAAIVMVTWILWSSYLNIHPHPYTSALLGPLELARGEVI